MGFYHKSKQDRNEIVDGIVNSLLADIKKEKQNSLLQYFGDEDTYIRKAAYLTTGKLYILHPELKAKIIRLLEKLLSSNNYLVRQSVINAAGEIGKKDFSSIENFFDKGLFDSHYSPRNAVIGSIKKMSAANPRPVLKWAKKYLHHPDKEIRREICHGIELRGRTHPEDILPMLKELQHDKTARVRNTLVHVIGQIAYKPGCLPKVVEHLKTWDNSDLVADAFDEIVDVHKRYKDFAAMSPKEAKKYVSGKRET